MAGRRRIPNPLLWSDADKGLLVVAIMLPNLVVFALTRQFLNGWPHMPWRVGDAATESLRSIQTVGILAWVVAGALGLVLRRKAPSNRLYVHGVIHLYAVSIAIFLYLSGPFHAPGWIFFLGGAIIGQALFGSRVTFPGVATFFLLLCALLAGGELGYLGDLAQVTALVPAENDARSYMVRLGFSSALFAIGTLVVAGWIIGQWRLQSRALEEMSRTDALTGLVNRRHFMDESKRELFRARRYGTHLACVLIDLDHFKKINDTHGHLVGDDVLVAVSKALSDAVRASDVVARYGGEEIVVLLPETDLRGATELAERFRQRIANVEVEAGAAKVHVTASFGVSSFPEVDTGRIEGLLSAADEALYRAKRGGRNCVEVAAAA